MTDVQFFQVGGCVRDELLGLKSKDIDFAVQCDGWDHFVEVVEARCSKVFQLLPENFTARGLSPELGPVDFVMCRKDGPSSDGRHPDFVEAGTIFDDLARRDFTVNAMARDESGVLLDPHGGQEDLAARRLRFVGTPEARLAEDALRALRGVRFEITKGFALGVADADAINKMVLSDFDAVSANRVRDELVRCFAHDWLLSLRTLDGFPILLELADARGVWLKPTLEDR